LLCIGLHNHASDPTNQTADDNPDNEIHVETPLFGQMWELHGR
jgi:hypothetical protein